MSHLQSLADSYLHHKHENSSDKSELKLRLTHD